VEADLLEVYGVDLMDLGTDRLTWGRLGRLVRQLPPTSRTTAAVLGHSPWSASEHLLAAVVDVLAAANWQRAQAASKKAIPRPEPIPRPGAQQRTNPRRTTLTPEQIAARLRAQRRN
jgi:hypothetical protein